MDKKAITGALCGLLKKLYLSFHGNQLQECKHFVLVDLLDLFINYLVRYKAIALLGLDNMPVLCCVCGINN